MSSVHEKGNRTNPHNRSYLKNVSCPFVFSLLYFFELRIFVYFLCTYKTVFVCFEHDFYNDNKWPSDFK